MTLALKHGISVGLLSFGALTVAAAQESASFKMQRLAVTTVAEQMSSPSYRNIINVSEVIGAAAVCPAGSATQLGFWSVLGPGPIPILLTVGKSSSSESDIELSWTGQAPSFGVYRSTSPIDMVMPENLLVTTSSCAVTDTTAAAVAYYVVSPNSP